MKKFCVLVAALAATLPLMAQTSAYTLLLNVSPEGKNYPVMIGLVNRAFDNRGMMMGLLNTVGKDARGAHLGLGNVIGGDYNGALFGVTNMVSGSVRGAQFGLVNVFGEHGQGALFGLLNHAGEYYRGAQFGILNMTGTFSGLQLGVFNIASISGGLQIGVFNYCDEVSYRQIPFGMVSIVRKGGFQAVELSSDFMFPVSVAFKSGVPGLYTSLIAAMNPDFDRYFAIGAGVGSIVELFRKVFFNPEFSYKASLGSGSASFFDLSPNFGYRFGEHFSLLAAPVFAMQHTDRDTALNKPLYHLYKNRIDSRNELYVGLRLALRYNFDW